jgi:hypothetical protein
LQKFAKILEPHDDTYIKRLNEFRDKLKGLLKDKLESIKVFDIKFLDHGNRLSEQEIIILKDALEFE